MATIDSYNSNIGQNVERQKFGDSEFEVTAGKLKKDRFLKLREVDSSQGLYALYLKNNAWLESPAYDPKGEDSNGFVGLFRLNTENRLEVGSALSILENIELPDNPGQGMPVIDMAITDSQENGVEHSYTFRINYDSVLSIFGVADGDGNIKKSGVKITNEIVLNAKKGGPGNIRISEDHGALSIQKFDGEVWVTMYSISLTDTPPKPLNLKVSGTPSSGESLSVEFDYYSAMERPEGAHSYRWFRADAVNGSNEEVIVGETGASYRTSDGGKYLTCEITVRDVDGRATTRKAPYVGPIL